MAKGAGSVGVRQDMGKIKFPASAGIHGTFDARFRPMAEVMQAIFEDGDELGGSLGMTWRGKPVVDLWAGWSDRARTRPWQKDTVVQVYSISKLMILMCILRLVDRGDLALDLPIAVWWPEFAAGGKEKVTLRDVMARRDGVPGFRPPVSFEDLHDWKRITDQLAAQPHWFDGRPELCYQPVALGYVLGETVRRATGKTLRTLFRDEFARKTGADFQMGLTRRSDLARLAELDFPKVIPRRGASIGDEVNTSTGVGDWSSWDRITADIPSSNAYGNGRSIARLLAILAMRGKPGLRRYISREAVAEAGRVQAEGIDHYIGPVRYGLMVGLDNPALPAPSASSMHWGGIGGSWGIADPVAGLSVGWAPNRMIFSEAGPLGDTRLASLVDTLTDLIPNLPQ